MSKEHRQAEMEAFGAAMLSEDYGGVPEGWGLQQMCGAGFGGKTRQDFMAEGRKHYEDQMPYYNPYKGWQGRAFDDGWLGVLRARQEASRAWRAKRRKAREAQRKSGGLSFGGMKAKNYFDKGYVAEVRVEAARKHGIQSDPRNPYSEGSWQANAWSRGAAAAKGYRPPERGITLDPRRLFPESFGGNVTKKDWFNQGKADFALHTQRVKKGLRHADLKPRHNSHIFTRPAGGWQDTAYQEGWWSASRRYDWLNPPIGMKPWESHLEYARRKGEAPLPSSLTHLTHFGGKDALSYRKAGFNAWVNRYNQPWKKKEGFALKGWQGKAFRKGWDYAESTFDAGEGRWRPTEEQRRRWRWMGLGFGGKTAKDYEREGRAFGLKQARHWRNILPSPVTRGELTQGSWQFDAWVRGYSAGSRAGYAAREDAIGQGPWPGVDTAVQGGIQEYALNWGNAALDVADGKVSEAEIDDAAPDGAEAVVALQSAVNALWGAAGQLQQTQRGRARGGRYRHRQLVTDARTLLSTFFRGATDVEGSPLEWQDVVGDLPSTSIGPPVFTFGKKAKEKRSKFVPVEGEGGIIRLSIPSILTAADAIELANQVSKTANAIRDLAFTWQSRGQGVPQIPSDFIMRSLSQQSSIIPSNVFTVGGGE